jgi:hypothetical protein
VKIELKPGDEPFVLLPLIFAICALLLAWAMTA